MTFIFKFTLVLNLPPFYYADAFELTEVCGSSDPLRSSFEVQGAVGIILPIWFMGGFFPYRTDW